MMSREIDDKIDDMAERARERIVAECRRRVDALVALTSLPRARCIGLLEAEAERDHRFRCAALAAMFREIDGVGVGARASAGDAVQAGYDAARETAGDAK